MYRNVCGVPSNVTLLWIASSTFLTFALAEIVAAYASNSMSLLGDAVTMVVDALSYFFNMYAEKKKAKATRIRALELEIISPLVSVVILIFISLYIIHDSLNDLSSEEEDNVDDTLMLIFSITNLVFDLFNIFCFYRAKKLFGYQMSEKHGSNETETQEQENNEVEDNVNMNMCSAYTHVCADTFRSIAVLVAAVLSKTTDIPSSKADAYAAIAVSVIIMITTFPLFSSLAEKYSELRELKSFTEQHLTPLV